MQRSQRESKQCEAYSLVMGHSLLPTMSMMMFSLIYHTSLLATIVIFHTRYMIYPQENQSEGFRKVRNSLQLFFYLLFFFFSLSIFEYKEVIFVYFCVKMGLSLRTWVASILFLTHIVHGALSWGVDGHYAVCKIAQVKLC